MKKIFLSGSLLGVLVLAVAVSAASANFAGTWLLDKSKSQGLGRRQQAADSVTWTITQTDKQITIEEKTVGGDMGGGGGGGNGGGAGNGGGGGRGFGGGAAGPRSFNLDGSDTPFEMGPAKGTRKTSWSGSTLELISKATFSGQQGEITTTSSDKLSLSGDGKTLTVNRHSESPRGAQDSTLVFNKQ
jgi:hypothetical protein